MTPGEVDRCYVTVGARQVHYRRLGSGPAVVILHESPLSSRAQLPLTRELAASFTVIALDNPGYGSSDPLAEPNPEIGDFTAALVDTLDALGIRRAAFYGAHAGSCIALDLADRFPERVTATVLDGLPRFTPEERADLLEHYTPPLDVRWDGTHLLAAWNQRRDMKLFFPWFRKEAAARQAIIMPSPLVLHEDALDLIKAKDHYAKAYQAAFRFEVEAPLARVAVPTAVVARGDEILGEPKFENASPAVHIELLPTDRGGWAAAIHRILRESPQAEAPPPAPATAPVAEPAGAPVAGPAPMTRRYLRSAHGLVFVRSWSAATGRPLVLLHPSPFSGALLVPLAQELGRTRPVLLVDTPGYGDSDPLPEEEPAIADFAEGILGALGHLADFDVVGSLTGSAIAAELALRAPGRVRALVLDTPPLFDAALRDELYRQMTPEMPDPTGDGALLVWAWSFARDHATWFPHYCKTPEFARLEAPPTPDNLHLRALELLKTGKTYRCGPRAAFRYDYEGRFPGITTRTLVCSHPRSTAYQHLRQAAALVPGAELLEHDGTAAGTAAVVAAFLDAAGKERRV